MFPVLYKSQAEEPCLFFFYHSRSFSSSFCRSAFFFLFLFHCSVSKWQLWESTVARWCHVNQMRCHNRKSVHMHGRSTVTHAHDLLPLQAKYRPSRHRYTDMNLLWVKGNCTLSQTPSYLLQHIWHDIQSEERFDQTSGSVRKLADSRWWFRENSSPWF